METTCDGSAVPGRGKNVARRSRRDRGQGWNDEALMVAETRRILAQGDNSVQPCARDARGPGCHVLPSMLESEPHDAPPPPPASASAATPRRTEDPTQ